MMLPVAVAEAEVKIPWERWVEPGKLDPVVPLELCAKSPLARQATDTTPVGPAKVTKFGLPVVLVRNFMEVPPPLRSLFGIGPKPLPTSAQEPNRSHRNTK